MVALTPLGLVRDQLEVIERHTAARLSEPSGPGGSPSNLGREVEELIEFNLVAHKQVERSYGEWAQSVRLRRAKFEADDLLQRREILRRQAALDDRLLQLAARAESLGFHVEGVSQLRAARENLLDVLSVSTDDVLRSLGLQLTPADLERLARFETPLDQWPEQPDDLIAD